MSILAYDIEETYELHADCDRYPCELCRAINDKAIIKIDQRVQVAINYVLGAVGFMAVGLLLASCFLFTEQEIQANVSDYAARLFAALGWKWVGVIAAITIIIVIGAIKEQEQHER